MQCMLQNILKEVIFWALLASGDFHNNEVQCPRKALLADAWSEILAGLSELGLTVLTRLWSGLCIENTSLPYNKNNVTSAETRKIVSDHS